MMYPSLPPPFFDVSLKMLKPLIHLNLGFAGDFSTVVRGFEGKYWVYLSGKHRKQVGK